MLTSISRHWRANRYWRKLSSEAIAHPQYASSQPRSQPSSRLPSSTIASADRPLSARHRPELDGAHDDPPTPVVVLEPHVHSLLLCCARPSVTLHSLFHALNSLVLLVGVAVLGLAAYIDYLLLPLPSSHTLTLWLLGGVALLVSHAGRAAFPSPRVAADDAPHHHHTPHHHRDGRPVSPSASRAPGLHALGAHVSHLFSCCACQPRGWLALYLTAIAALCASELAPSSSASASSSIGHLLTTEIIAELRPAFIAQFEADRCVATRAPPVHPPPPPPPPNAATMQWLGGRSRTPSRSLSL